MLVNPINTVNPTTNFRAVIKPTKSLEQGFNMVEQFADTGSVKYLNYAKDFLDSLNKISESGSIKDFSIQIDKRRENYTYTQINGRRIKGGHNENLPNIKEDYLAVEGVKEYANKLKNSEEPAFSILDTLKQQVEEAQAMLYELQESYSRRIHSELEQARKMIFKTAE